MKIIVIGSPGAGKSYFSKRLCEKLNIPIYHLDNIYWNADKTHISREQLKIKVDEIMKTDNWLIDGNYISTIEQRISGADKIILFDCETEVCIDGVISRMGTERTDLPWVEETMDIAINSVANVLYFCNMGKDRTGVLSAMILKKLGKSDEYIINDYTKTYANVKKVLKTYVESNPHVDINVITPKAEHMSRFLEMLNRNKYNREDDELTSEESKENKEHKERQ